MLFYHFLLSNSPQLEVISTKPIFRVIFGKKMDIGPPGVSFRGQGKYKVSFGRVS